MIHLVSFVFILVAPAILPWWLLVPLWAYYAFVFRAYELVVLGVFLDAYVGYALPWHIFYTLSGSLLFFIAEFLKPRMTLYHKGS